MAWRPSWGRFSMKLLMTSQSRVLTPSILLGVIISATIALTVSADLTNCTPSPSGLVSWWRGDGSALDQLGLNNGMLQTGCTYTNGEVGQAFIFDGVSSYVKIPNSASLDAPSQLTIDFRIE